MSDLLDLIEVIKAQDRRIKQLETALQSMVTFGKVEDSDHEKGVRLRIGGTDDKPHLGPWTQPGDWSGTSRYLPRKGEQVMMLAAFGDRRQAVVLPLGHSDDKPNPAPDGDTTVLHNRDDVKLSIKSGTLTAEIKTFVVKCGGVTYTLNADGHTFKGGKVKHEDKNIGSDHKHDRVQPGFGQTGDPVA